MSEMQKTKVMIGKKMNIEKYSKLYPEELKYIANNIPKHNNDKNWALLIYLILHKQKGNIITMGKLSRFFAIPEDEVAYRLNQMHWLVESYIMSYGYDKIVQCYEINFFGEKILMKLLELIDMKNIAKD